MRGTYTIILVIFSLSFFFHSLYTKNHVEKLDAFSMLPKYRYPHLLLTLYHVDYFKILYGVAD